MMLLHHTETHHFFSPFQHVCRQMRLSICRNGFGACWQERVTLRKDPLRLHKALTLFRVLKSQHSSLRCLFAQFSTKSTFSFSPLLWVFPKPHFSSTPNLLLPYFPILSCSISVLTSMLMIFTSLSMKIYENIY